MAEIVNDLVTNGWSEKGLSRCVNMYAKSDVTLREKYLHRKRNCVIRIRRTVFSRRMLLACIGVQLVPTISSGN